MGYIKIKSGSTAKQYTLTNNYPKPYLRVSNSYLPLTEATTTGMRLRVKTGAKSYRAMEYKSSSSSTTYRTTAASPSVLSSTTALTEEETTSVKYGTLNSAVGTNLRIILTTEIAQLTNGLNAYTYLTTTRNAIYDVKSASLSLTNNYYWSVTSWLYTVYTVNETTASGNTYRSGSQVGTSFSSSRADSTSATSSYESKAFAFGFTEGMTSADNFTWDNNLSDFVVNPNPATYIVDHDSYENNQYQWGHEYNSTILKRVTSYETVTTGTTYLTSAKTTGYSGVSSSSTSTMAWH